MPVTKDLKRPSWMTDKKMHWDDPWCETELPNFIQHGNTLTTQVIKFYANDCTQAGARFQVHSFSDAMGGSEMRDSGDEYCANVFKGKLVKVHGRAATDEEKREWLHLQSMAKEIVW